MSFITFDRFKSLSINFICFILLISSPVLRGEDSHRDSLVQMLPSMKEDTARVNLLLEIADLYETNHQDSSLYYLEKARDLSVARNYKKGLFRYYQQKGIVLLTMGSYAESIRDLDSANALVREMGDSLLLVNILVNKGIVYQYMGKYDLQLKNFLDALKIVEDQPDKKKLATIYHNLGTAYYNLKQYGKCIESCNLALKAYREFGGPIYLNRVLSTLGQGYEELNMNDSALYYYRQAIRESGKINDTYAEASIYGYMSLLYGKQGDYSSMIGVSEKMLTLARELQSSQLMANSLYNLAGACFYNGREEDAKKYIDEAMVIAEKDGLSEELRNIYLLLSYIAIKENDYNTSFLARKKSDSIQMVTLNNEVIRTTAELQEKYESEKSQNRIKLQEARIQRKNSENRLLILGIFMLLLPGYLFYRNFRQKQKIQAQRIQELETEKQLMATESVLKGEEKERTRLAKDLHDGLSGMLSGLKYSFMTMKENLIMTAENQQAFEKNLDSLDSTIKELRRIAHNMMPETLIRFGLDAALRDFCAEISQSGALRISYHSSGMKDLQTDQTVNITIYRIIQELVSNTLKHSHANTAIVQLIYAENRLTITMEDDGKGFDTTILDSGTPGMGWANIRNRIEFLKASLDIRAVAGEGTSVQIEVRV